MAMRVNQSPLLSVSFGIGFASQRGVSPPQAPVPQAATLKHWQEMGSAHTTSGSLSPLPPTEILVWERTITGTSRMKDACCHSSSLPPGQTLPRPLTGRWRWRWGSQWPATRVVGEARGEVAFWTWKLKKRWCDAKQCTRRSASG